MEFCSMEGGIGSVSGLYESGSFWIFSIACSTNRRYRSRFPLHGRNRILLFSCVKWQKRHKMPFVQSCSVPLKAHGLHPEEWCNTDPKDVSMPFSSTGTS